MKVRIQRIDKENEMVKYAHDGDAAFDLRSSGNINLSAKGKVIVPTGVKMAIPEGFAGFIWDRSGLAANSSLHCLAGVVDSGYRGEVKVVLVNLSKHDMYIMKGMRIAQMVIQKIEHPILEEVESLDETKRNDGGFGSTGLH
ncbi:dUTP diphosphatase [Candidatus Woesearchaeota archaeon]|jgi:dUTP pyrophosphatase|nr:dUTP diphosphatase [Candidatus Woesearchaeota archaeon]